MKFNPRIIKLIIILLMIIPAFIIHAENVKYIFSGTPAPFTGYLFTIEYNDRVTRELAEYDVLKTKYHILDYMQIETEKLKGITNDIKTGVDAIIKENERLYKAVNRSLKFNIVLFSVIGVIALLIIAIVGVNLYFQFHPG